MKNKLSCILKFSIISIIAIFFVVLLNHNISYAEEEINTPFDPSTCDARYGKGHCGKNINWLISSDRTLHVYYKVFTDRNKKYAHLKDGEMENFSIKNNKIPGWHGKNFKKVVIHPGIRSIGDCSFLCLDSKKGIKNSNSNSRKLKELVINSDLERIGVCAFLGCEYLTGIDLQRVKKIDRFSFQNCKGLISVGLTGNVEYIGNSAFEGTGIKYVTLSSKITKVCQNAFRIHGLDSIFIPKNSNFNELKLQCSNAIIYGSNTEICSYCLSN